MVPISSSECEWGFSQTNLILTSTRASLSTTTVSELLFVWVVEPPLRHFSSTKYVESWIREDVIPMSTLTVRSEPETWSMTKIWSKCGVS
jgi:hypothetical protein